MSAGNIAGGIDVVVQARLDKLQQGLAQAEARVAGSSQTMNQTMADGGTKAAESWGKNLIGGLRGQLRAAIFSQAMVGAMSVVKVGVQAIKGEWERVEESVSQLPFGIGAAWQAGRALKGEIDGFADAAEKAAKNWERFQTAGAEQAAYIKEMLRSREQQIQYKESLRQVGAGGVALEQLQLTAKYKQDVRTLKDRLAAAETLGWPTTAIRGEWSKRNEVYQAQWTDTVSLGREENRQKAEALVSDRMKRAREFDDRRALIESRASDTTGLLAEQKIKRLEATGQSYEARLAELAERYRVRAEKAETPMQKTLLSEMLTEDMQKLTRGGGLRVFNPALEGFAGGGAGKDEVKVEGQDNVIKILGRIESNTAKSFAQPQAAVAG